MRQTRGLCNHQPLRPMMHFAAIFSQRAVNVFRRQASARNNTHCTAIFATGLCLLNIFRPRRTMDMDMFISCKRISTIEAGAVFQFGCNLSGDASTLFCCSGRPLCCCAGLACRFTPLHLEGRSYGPVKRSSILSEIGPKWNPLSGSDMPEAR